MKIIYCLPQLYRPGGIERIVSIKANWLVDIANYDVVIAVSCQNNKPTYYPISSKIKIVDLGIDYDSLLHLPLLRRICTKTKLQKLHKKKLENLLLKEKADITISTFTHEASFLPYINDGSKKVLEFHFCRGHKKKMADAFGFGLFTKLAYYYRCWEEENLIIPQYDQFVVLTEEDKNCWKEKVPNVRCIPNILPFEKEGKAKLDSKQVIAVGRLDAQKGFDKLIEIWANIAESYPDWCLNIYGLGRDENKLKSLIDSYGCKNIVLHNPVKQIKQKYMESSIFCMTSNYEGLPMTLLEAIGLGLPVVCYDFACGPKDIIENGVNGYIVENGDMDSFSQCLSKLMDSYQLRKRMGEQAYMLSQKYNKESVMKQWALLFEELSVGYLDK